MLSSDSGNIIEILTTEYKNIKNTVILKSDHESDLFDVNFKVLCKNQLIDGNKCSNLELSDVVEFTITITAKNCSTATKKVRIGPEAFSEKLTLNIDVNCKCDCEQPGKTIPNSAKCKGE